MEFSTLKHLSSANVKLVKSNDEKFYIVDGDNPQKIYDLSAEWNNIGTSKGYLKEGTQQKIIGELRQSARWNDDIKLFIAWYDNLNNPQPKSPDGTVDNSELLLQLQKMTEVMKQSSRFEAAMVEGIVEKGKLLATEELKNELMDSLNEFISKTYGILPKVIKIVTPEKTKEIQGTFHSHFQTILSFVTAKVPLLLVGPAGSGKNFTVEQIAEALDLKFYFSNAITQEYKLSGFVDANGTYQETEFYRAFKNGGLFFFDEMDASSAESLIIVNGALANGYFDFPNGKIYAHPDFRVVAAANTFGNGADAIYIGRNQLDGATLDRFSFLTFDYDPTLEKSLAYSDDLYEFISDFRRAITARNLRFVISMRATINSKKMLEAGLDKQLMMKTVITKSMTKDDINSILNEMRVSNEWTSILRKVA